jgi:hypothetical protein
MARTIDDAQTQVAALAQELYDALEARERDDRTKYVALKEGSPEWMREAIYTAHDGMALDDSRYAMVMASALAIVEAEDIYQAEDELPQAIDYVEYGALAAWLSRYTAVRLQYVDEAVAEYGLQAAPERIRLAAGMDSETREVLSLLRAALLDKAADL